MNVRFGKSDRFIVHQQSPFNGGVHPGALGQDALTPVSDFYVRGHGPVPTLDAETFVLHVGGMVNRPLTLSLDDLRQQFAERTLEITLQCAGNRRTELDTVRPMQKNALLWTTEAISNATWTGVELGDILKIAGVQSDASHVELLGSDFDPRQWAHEASWDTAGSRVQMWLRARQALTVRWPGGERMFAAGERIHTENAFKWTPEAFAALLRDAGWRTPRHWRAGAGRFAVFLASA